jgi:hypothetical protein
MSVNEETQLDGFGRTEEEKMKREEERYTVDAPRLFVEEESNDTRF